MPVHAEAVVEKGETAATFAVPVVTGPGSAGGGSHLLCHCDLTGEGCSGDLGGPKHPGWGGRGDASVWAYLGAGAGAGSLQPFVQPLGAVVHLGAFGGLWGGEE